MQGSRTREEPLTDAPQIPVLKEMVPLFAYFPGRWDKADMAQTKAFFRFMPVVVVLYIGTWRCT
jgi:hypothetical protein